MYRKFKPASTKVANPRRRRRSGAKRRRSNPGHKAAHNPRGTFSFKMRRKRRKNPGAGGGMAFGQKQMIELALYAAGAGVSTAAVTAIVERLLPADLGKDADAAKQAQTRTVYAAAGSAVIGAGAAYAFRKKRNVAKFFAIHGIISAGYALLTATKTAVDEQVAKLFEKDPATTSGLYLTHSNTGLLQRDMSGLVLGGSTGTLASDLKPARRAMF